MAISILTDREQDAMELIANVIEKATATFSKVFQSASQ